MNCSGESPELAERRHDVQMSSRTCAAARPRAASSRGRNATSLDGSSRCPSHLLYCHPQSKDTGRRYALAGGSLACRGRGSRHADRFAPPVRYSPDLLVPTLLLLTATTGLVDAVAFLGLGRVFTANMTGNVVFLAFAIAGAKGLSVSASVLALVCFLAGALAGGRLAVAMDQRSRRQWMVIATSGEALLLAGAVVAAIGVPINGTFGQRWPIVALTAAAMGVRNATVRRLGAADLTTTVLTLTLTGLAADSSFAGGTNPRPTRRVGSVVAMFSGALVGAVLVLHQGLVWPLAIACGFAVIAVVSLSSCRRTQPLPPTPTPREFRVAALPQPRQHVPGDLFDLRVSPGQPVRPVGRPRRHHGRAGLVRVRTQHRVAVTDAFHRLGVTRPEHA